jgi:two-component system sensor histidine kinase AlgZ
MRTSFGPESTLGFEFSGVDRPPLLRLVLRTLAINQLIALPIGLAMTSVGGSFGRMLLIATIYSQTIGITCSVLNWLAHPLSRNLAEGRRRLVLVLQYFAWGAAGAEIARWVAPALVGVYVDAGHMAVSWAIGAVVAGMVGLVLMLVQQLRARVVATEFEALQARINPHFLFNTLNSIAALIREDPLRAEAMTLNLSSLFRYTLQAPRQGLVTLEEEMAIVEGYLSIEQERLGERLRYTVDVAPALLPVRVPALAVQPLVENAIKHGIADSLAGGDITVTAAQHGGMVSIAVTNSGDGTGMGGGIGEGLDNVRRRLRTALGPSATLTLERQGGRTCARIQFGNAA